MVETQASLAEVGEHLPDLRQFVDDDSVSEIIVNGPGRLFIERGGRLERVPVADGRLAQRDLEAAAAMITRGSGFDLRREPIVDVRLGDGSRAAIAAPPVSAALAITIRRFSKCLFSAADLVEMGSLPREVLQVVRDTLLCDGNVLIAGGTGSGKTTLLNACVGLLPPSDRIVVIEDTMEIRLTHVNALRLEGRAFGRQGGEKSGVRIRDLVRHTLRHRPDHIVLGEVRGPEAADVIQALVTGHGGSLSTIHASTCEGALSRLATCALQAGDGLPWDVVCHCGRRRLPARRSAGPRRWPPRGPRGRCRPGLRAADRGLADADGLGGAGSGRAAGRGRGGGGWHRGAVEAGRGRARPAGGPVGAGDGRRPARVARRHAPESGDTPAVAQARFEAPSCGRNGGVMSVVESEPAVPVDAAAALAEAEEAARRRREQEAAGGGAAGGAPEAEPPPGAGESRPEGPGAAIAALATERGRGGRRPPPPGAGRAAAVIAELLALRGVGDKAVADIVVAQLAGAGVDVDKLVREIEAAQDRDRVSVAAEALAGQLRDVIEQVQRTAGASGAAVEVRLKEMESLAYVLIQTALAAQATLDHAERSGGRIGTRLQDIVRAADEFLSAVGGAHAEVIAAEKSAGQWVEYAGTVGRGLWWWALVGGFAGAVVGVFVSLRLALGG